ncbi:MAG: TlpA family protein disulfide reductase [Bacteroidia bacterium]
MLKKALLAPFAWIPVLCLGLCSCADLSAEKMESQAKSWLETLTTPQQSSLQKIENGYRVSGQVANRPNALVSLWEMTPSQLVFLDSVRADGSGRFSIEGQTQDFVFAMIQVDEQQAVFLGLEKQSKVDVQIDPSTQPMAYSLKGEQIEACRDLQKLIDLNQGYIRTLSGIEKEAQSLANDAAGMARGQELEGKYYQTLEARESAIQEFALEREKGYIPFFIIQFGVLPEPSYELFKHAVKAAEAYSSEAAYTQLLKTRFESEAKLMIGAVAPDLSFPTPSGESLSLSSLRGQYVMLDFWASWCGPCRRENPNVVKLYNQYHSKGFEILGVSLDQDPNRWKQAISADGLTWPHISDLKGWGSEAAQIYQVRSIPQTFLLDPQGRIIAKGLRGEELENKLAELLGAE